MSTLEKLKMLRELYVCRAIGFEYYKEPKEINSEPNTYMPNNMDELKQVVSKCYLCQLCKGRKNVVFGEGNTKTKLMFIGEGPGANEDASGKPFVGQAGQLLTKIIENVLNLKRNDVYIANIVKCRPPQNRAPTYEEANICRPYLLKQIEIINPSIIVALGSTSFRYLTDDETPISRVRGEIIQYKNVKLIPTFHPSFLLRTPSAKKDVWKDMLKVKGLL
ncbi:MAG: uracil-DNA glycosylase [Campylobacteraceae bacterium]|jgi:DNA polymerase|nr:uracil-DNA glycosylase [Campylobacteraceae bacterium]